MLVFDIEVPRNGSYYRRWQLTDNVDAPIDLTSHSLSLEARAVAGSGGSVIASATFSARDDADGSFNVLLLGSDFAAVDGEMETVRLHWRLLVTTPDSVPIQTGRGGLLLTPGD